MVYKNDILKQFAKESGVRCSVNGHPPRLITWDDLIELSLITERGGGDIYVYWSSDSNPGDQGEGEILLAGWVHGWGNLLTIFNDLHFAQCKYSTYIKTLKDASDPAALVADGHIKPVVFDVEKARGRYK